jgi:hypothetical protein
MARAVKKQRGVFERPKDSGVWWICYFDQFGKKHREKVGLCRIDHLSTAKNRSEAREVCA